MKTTVAVTAASVTNTADVEMDPKAVAAMRILIAGLVGHVGAQDAAARLQAEA